MVVKYREVKGRYLDSIILMSISRDLEGRKGVKKAGVMMMTKENIETFHDIGFDLPPPPREFFNLDRGRGRRR